MPGVGDADQPGLDLRSGDGGRIPATSRQITAVAANVSVAGPMSAPSCICSGAR